MKDLAPVRFERGASQAAIKARIQGDETVDSVLFREGLPTPAVLHCPS